MIKDDKQAEIDSLESQLDAQKEILDTKRKSLETTKEQADYEKELADKNKAVVDIQNELASLQFDTSREGIAKRLQLEDDLANATEDRDALVNDKIYENKQAELDREEAYWEDYYGDKIQTVQNYLDNESKIVSDANAKLKNMSQSTYDDLVKWNAKYGDGIRSTITSAWNTAYKAMTTYKSTAESILGGKLTTTTNYKIKKGDTLKSIAKKYGTTVDRIRSANNGITDKALKVGANLKIPKYANGIIGVSSDQIANINELGDELVVRANGKGDITALTKGSGVIPANLTKNLMDWGKMNPNMFSQLS